MCKLCMLLTVYDFMHIHHVHNTNLEQPHTPFPIHTHYLCVYILNTHMHARMHTLHAHLPFGKLWYYSDDVTCVCQL